MTQILAIIDQSIIQKVLSPFFLSSHKKKQKGQGCNFISGNSRNCSSTLPKLANAISGSTASDG